MTTPPAATESKPLTDAFHLLITCPNEDAQRQLYAQLTTAGHPCRVLTRLGPGQIVGSAVRTETTVDHPANRSS